MTVLPIYVVPQPVLKQEAETVAEITADIRQLAQDMLETMYAARGIGLAAPQIGVLKRVVVMDVEQDDPDDSDGDADEKETRGTRTNPRIFINPEIVAVSEDMNVYQEGCLSIPGQYADIERPATVRVRFLDENGVQHEEEATGLYATCMQHEIDHLNGILFTDHLSKLKRDMLLKKVKKWSREIDDETKAAYVL